MRQEAMNSRDGGQSHHASHRDSNNVGKIAIGVKNVKTSILQLLPYKRVAARHSQIVTRFPQRLGNLTTVVAFFSKLANKHVVAFPWTRQQDRYNIKPLTVDILQQRHANPFQPAKSDCR